MLTANKTSLLRVAFWFVWVGFVVACHVVYRRRLRGSSVTPSSNTG